MLKTDCISYCYALLVTFLFLKETDLKIMYYQERFLPYIGFKFTLKTGPQEATKGYLKG